MNFLGKHLVVMKGLQLPFAGCLAPHCGETEGERGSREGGW